MRWDFEKWQKRCSEFNHDWLKNGYIPALAKCLNLLDDLIEDREFEELFVPSVLPQWESHRHEAITLVADYENFMSPRNLFNRPPLTRCKQADEQWLRALVHALWLARNPVKQWVSEASNAVRSADAAYLQLRERLQNCSDVLSVEDLRPLRSQFSEFYERCQRLGLEISKLLSEVRVV